MSRCPLSYRKGCRCPECRADHAALARYYRTLRRETRVLTGGVLTAPLPPEAHGQLSTYVNWGCRCDRCMSANAAYSRKWRNR